MVVDVTELARGGMLNELLYDDGLVLTNDPYERLWSRLKKCEFFWRERE